MTTDDAPRPALDAGTLEALLDAADLPLLSETPEVAALRQFLLDLLAAAARADRYERALTTIQHWDCLNPPNEALCGDFPWLKRLVDRVLRGGEAMVEDAD